jgi:phosphomevalonate kinase
MALSAPGKVLLTGGYLCLDRGYTGTVFALDARIHVIVQQLRRGHRRGASGSDPAEAEEEGQDTVVVRSPQFLDAVWEYGVQRCANGGGVKVVQKGDGYVPAFCTKEYLAKTPQKAKPLRRDFP